MELRGHASTQLDPENPWPGLESYDESSREFFSGRGTESDELLRRVLDEPVTVLFGKSGLGKSSLLKAGVFPRLRDKGYLPILIRLQIRPGAAPLIEQMRLALFEALHVHEVDHPPAPAGQTLWEYLHAAGLEFWTKQNRMARPVFVLDQVEELFTLGRAVPAEVAAFREALADLAENRIPAALAQRLKDRPVGGQEIDEQAMPYKIVLSLREDFLADLEGWRPIMPSLRRNRMRLLPMGPEQAMRAVYNERTRHLVSEPLAHRIVTFLSSSAADEAEAPSGEATGLAVEPALLSLFCRGVNEHRKELGAPEITEAMFEGGKETIVTEFYRRSLQGFPDRVRRFVEDKLITEHGYRNSYSVEDALAHGFVDTVELAALVDGRLLRQEHLLGTDRVELTHDILTKAALEERDRRRRDEQAASERRQRRRLWTVVGASGALTLVFLGLAVSFWNAKEAAVKAADEAQKERDRADGLARDRKTDLDKLTTTLNALQAAETGREEALKAAKASANDASKEASRASKEASRAKSKELAALAETVQDHDPELAVLLALEGLDRADTPEARSALLTAAQYLWPSALLDANQLGGKAKVVALSPNGDLLAVLAGDAALSVWDVSGPRPTKLWSPGTPIKDAMFIAFNPDQELLAVARDASVDLFHARTGRLSHSLPQSGEPRRRIVFGPEGKWLASIQKDGKIRMWDYRNQNAAEVTVPAKGLVEIALLRDGKGIVGVGNSPALFANKLELRPDGTWVPAEVDFARCLKLQSASPGAARLSATLRARTCLYTVAALNDSPQVEESDDRVIDDMVWSAGGNSFAEFLTSRDIIIGAGSPRDARRESRIKGAKPDSAVSKTHLLSVSEDGARVALIDQANAVRVYSLSPHKPLLSMLDARTVDMSPDGRWIATSRQPAPWIDVIPIDLARREGGKHRMPIRIPLPAAPTEVFAVQDTVVAVVPEPKDRSEITLVFDAATGERRVEPRAGNLHVIGEEGELLIVGPPAGSRGPRAVIRSRDGTVVTSWDEKPGGRSVMTSLSPSRTALGLLRRSASDSKQFEVTVYAVRGNRLVPTGLLVDLPGSASVMPADDGRSIVEETRAAEGTRLVWPLSASAPTSATDPARAKKVSEDVSPMARYEIRKEKTEGDRQPTFDVVQRSNGTTIKRLAGGSWRFSADDRWVVAWQNYGEAKGLRVLDLSSGEFALSIDPGYVDKVEFEARNTILKIVLDNGTMLVPLERGLMAQFARALTSRTLTTQERCLYGLGGAECRTQVAASRAPGPAASRAPGPVQKGASAPKQTRPASGTR